MSTRTIISEYFKTHDRATFPEIRVHCELAGCARGNISCAVHDMLNRGELTRSGNRGKYQYTACGDLKTDIKLGRPLGRKDGAPRQRRKSTPSNSVSRFDQLIRSVRG